MARSFSNVKVVIVDDNKNMRALLRAMLEAFGVTRIDEANDGNEGLKKLAEIQPDFVLTDYSMKPVDGVAFAKTIRKLSTPLAWVPIIMVTGHTERRYVEMARDAGVSETLCKPVTARDLYVRIVEVIDRPRRFVRSPNFAGPDRRRRKADYTGPKRRRDDQMDVQFT
jgi:CheY-like chemotaxis protein